MTTLRANKYGVAKREDRTVDGIVFASRREAYRYMELKILQKIGDITDLELQPVFKFPMGFKYVADFRYWDKRLGYFIIEDVKGVKTEVFKLKLKCLKHFYPFVNLVLV